jgi:hypothetical protein
MLRIPDTRDWPVVHVQKAALRAISWTRRELHTPRAFPSMAVPWTNGPALDEAPPTVTSQSTSSPSVLLTANPSTPPN